MGHREYFTWIWDMSFRKCCRYAPRTIRPPTNGNKMLAMNKFYLFVFNNHIITYILGPLLSYRPIIQILSKWVIQSICITHFHQDLAITTTQPFKSFNLAPLQPKLSHQISFWSVKFEFIMGPMDCWFINGGGDFFCFVTRHVSIRKLPTLVICTKILLLYIYSNEVFPHGL